MLTPKFTRNVGKLYGQLRLGKYLNPFPAIESAHKDWNEGYSEGLGLDSIPYGEMFDIHHVSGKTFSVCRDILDIGDPVVVLCPMFGILARRSDSDSPEIILSNVQKINGKAEGSSNPDESLDMIKLSENTGLVYSIRIVLRWVG